MRSVFALAVADFRERSRRYSFLVTMAAAAWLGWQVNAGHVVLSLGKYRGLPGSGWIGLQMAMAVAAFVTLVGFYVVKNTIERDRETGVGQIIAATPVSKAAYALGKALSNFALLALIVCVLALAALLMQLLAPGAPRVQVWPLLSPFLLIALPAMAAVAALAVLFESVRLLAGGLGNVAYFFVWSAGIALAGLSKSRALDVVGFGVLGDTVIPFLRARYPDYGGAVSLQAGPDRGLAEAVLFEWPGIDWTAELVASRLLWFGIALGLTLLAALLFDRFDTARAGAGAGAGDEDERRPDAAPAAAHRLTPLAPDARGTRFGALVAAELRLLLKGRRWWWWTVAAGLLLAQAVAPLAASRHHLLALAWIWPVLVWSPMGTREERHGTLQLLLSAPRALGRQLPALWSAGVLVALAAGSMAGLRLVLAGEGIGFLAWLSGALLVPSLALALGAVSGTSKLFEGLYTALWYIGPAQGTPAPALDFFGALPANAARAAAVSAAAAALLLGIAFAARGRRRGD